MNPADIKWADAPPSLPKGAKIAVLYGDPSKSGPFCLRLMAPAIVQVNGEGPFDVTYIDPDADPRKSAKK